MEVDEKDLHAPRYRSTSDADASAAGYVAMANGKTGPPLMESEIKSGPPLMESEIKSGPEINGGYTNEGYAMEEPVSDTSASGMLCGRLDVARIS